MKTKFLVSNMLCFLLVSTTFAGARTQSGGPSVLKTFEVYIDRDNDPNSGPDPTLNDGAAIAGGVELVLTITVQAGATPRVVLVEAQEWDGANAFLPPLISDASGWPVGANNGVSASEVVEAYMPRDRLGVAQYVNFYIQSGEAGAPFDLMGPAPFNFGVPIPVLSPWTLPVYIGLFLAAGIRWIRRDSRIRGTLVLLAGLLPVGAGTTIVLDGQVGDWYVAALDTDPVDDAAR